jgi:hypothetical protein
LGKKNVKVLRCWSTKDFLLQQKSCACYFEPLMIEPVDAQRGETLGSLGISVVKPFVHGLHGKTRILRALKAFLVFSVQIRETCVIRVTGFLGKPQRAKLFAWGQEKIPIEKTGILAERVGFEYHPLNGGAWG